MSRLPDPITPRDMRARKLYESGATVEECGDFLCLSKAAARVRLHRAGTKMRPRGAGSHRRNRRRLVEK